MEAEELPEGGDGPVIGRNAARAARAVTGPGSATWRLVQAAHERDESLTSKLAKVQMLAESSKLSSLKLLPHLATPPVRPVFTDHLREMEEQRAETQRSLDEALEAKQRERAARLERELQSIELARQMVEAQQTLIAQQDAIVAAQREQAREGRITRRWEIAVFVVSVLALVAAIILR